MTSYTAQMATSPRKIRKKERLVTPKQLVSKLEHSVAFGVTRSVRPRASIEGSILVYKMTLVGFRNWT